MKRLFFLFLLFVSPSLLAEWRVVDPGLDYQRVGESVHLFRIDPGKFRLDLLLASDYGAAALTSGRFRERSGASLVINGGFFDEVFRPLGLRERRGERIHPVRNASWGIFLLGGKGPAIIHQRDWNPEGVSMAIQVGPRLLVDGKVPSFKETGPSRRSALGITAEGLVVVAASDQPLLLREWALLLQKESVQALNLDGGGSSQISAKIGGFSLEVEGATGIPDAIAVFKR